MILDEEETYLNGLEKNLNGENKKELFKHVNDELTNEGRKVERKQKRK